MGIEDDFLLEDEDDAKTIEFIISFQLNKLRLWDWKTIFY